MVLGKLGGLLHSEMPAIATKDPIFIIV